MRHYGTVIAGAVQHVYRDVRVGWAETAAMTASTRLFVLATRAAPRRVAVTEHVTTRMLFGAHQPGAGADSTG